MLSFSGVARTGGHGSEESYSYEIKNFLKEVRIRGGLRRGDNPMQHCISEAGSLGAYNPS